jgi:uncharacterized protein (TIGR03545 family)
MIIKKKNFSIFVFIIIILFAFRFLFLETIIKSSLEKMFSTLPKTEVIISSLNLSILEAKIEINDMVFLYEDIADATMIGNIVGEIDVPQLLFGNLVVNKLYLLDIEVLPKEKFSFVKKEPKKLKENKDGILSKYTSRIISYFSVEGISERLEVDSLLDTSKNTFSSVLDKELKDLNDTYNEMQKTLASGDLDKSLKELEDRIKFLERNRPTDITKLPQYLKDIADLKTQYDKVQKSYNEKERAIRNFQNQINQSVKEIDNSAKMDMNVINSKINQAEVKKNNIVEHILGTEINNQVNNLTKIIEGVNKYRKSNKKSKKEKFQGKDIIFPQKDTYPVFYIKEVIIEGKDKQDFLFKGKATDVTHLQNVRNIPSKISLSQNMGSAISYIGITVDMRQELEISLENFMHNHVLKKSYWDNNSFPVEIIKGNYYLDITISYLNNKLAGNLNLYTSNLEMKLAPEINSKSLIERYFIESITRMPIFSLKIKVDGDLFQLNSNIDHVLQLATQGLIDREVEKVKEEFIQEWNNFTKEQEKYFKEEIEKFVF